MKKFLIFIILIMIPINVFAKGGIQVSSNSLTVTVGSTNTFKITATNTIGEVDITSSDSSVVKVNTNEWSTGMVDEGNTKEGIITITGVKEGTAIITLKIDAATFDNEDLSGTTKTIKVTVNPKPVLDNSNSIKELSIPGYNIVKIDENNYSLTVENDVSSITINAHSENSKAKLSGTGDYNLKVGENTITLVITSESGLQNKIYIKITRKDIASLNDLSSLISNSESSTVNVNINNSNNISINDLNKIQGSGKTVSLNYIDKNQKNIYSWIIDGNELSNIVDFNPKLSFSSIEDKKINIAANYASGKILNFSHSGPLPNGIRVKVFVGDTFDDNSLLNIYYYNNGSFELVKNGIKVENGYIEYGLSHCSTYFATMASLDNNNPVCNCNISNDNGVPGLVIFLGVSLSFLTLFNLWYFFIKKPKNGN